MNKIAVLLFALCAYAAEAPVIPDALAAKVWRAQTRLMNLQEQVKNQETEVRHLFEELTKACGESHVPADQDGLKCLPKK